MKKTSMVPVYLISLGAFALGMASYVTAGLIPLIEIDFNISTSIAAQLVTAFTLAYGLGSPIFVAMVPADKQKIGLLAALLIFSLANIGSAITNDFSALVFFRALAGIGAGVYLAMGISASAIIAGQGNQGKAISLIMTGMSSGVVLGVPISLFIAENSHWQLALWLIALLSFISLIGLYIKLPKLPSAKTRSIREKVYILGDFKVISILLVSLFAAISSLGLYTYLAPLVSSLDYTNKISLTAYLWVWGVGGVIGSIIVGPIINKIKGELLTIWIMLLLAISLLSIPFLSHINQWVLMLPIAIWGATGWALQVPQNNELIIVRNNNGDSDLAIALNESALYLGSAIGAATGGILLLLNFSIVSMIYFSSIIAFIGLFIQIIYVKKFK